MDVIVNHGHVRYEVRGPHDGPLLLLVPGAGCSRTTWAPELIERLTQRGVRTIVFDPRDTGESDPTPDDSRYTLWDLADDAAMVVRAVTSGRVSVLGHSLGGAVAQCLAVRYPELVRDMVLLGAPARPGRGLELGPEGLATFDTDWDDPRAVIAALTRSLGAHADRDGGWVREVFSARALPMSRRSIARHNEAAMATAPPSDDEVARITAPVLVVAGTADLSLPPSNGEVLAADMPSARLELVDGMGHWPCPHHIEELIPLIMDHLGDEARRDVADATGA